MNAVIMGDGDSFTSALSLLQNTDNKKASLKLAFFINDSKRLFILIFNDLED